MNDFKEPEAYNENLKCEIKEEVEDSEINEVQHQEDEFIREEESTAEQCGPKAEKAEDEDIDIIKQEICDAEFVNPASCNSPEFVASTSTIKTELDITEDTIGNKKKKIYFCSYCNMALETAQSFQKHLKCHSHSLTYRCVNCKESFYEYQHLTKHLDDCKHKAVVNEKGEILKKCDICNKSMTLKSMREHKSSHMKCETCGMQCTGWATLRSHQRNMHPNTCKLCKRVYSTVIGLEKHMRAEHEAKPIIFECGSCNKVFAKPRHLKEHESSHTKRGTFSCDLCGDIFVTIPRLRIHKRITHKLKKVYECGFCGVSLASKRSSAEHLNNTSPSTNSNCVPC